MDNHYRKDKTITFTYSFKTTAQVNPICKRRSEGRFSVCEQHGLFQDMQDIKW